MSRIVSGKMRLDVQPVDLPRHRAATRSTPCTPAADAKGVRSRRCVDPHAGAVSGDPGSAAAGRLEPAVQRREVHAARAAASRCACERVNSHVEVGGQRHGHRHPPDFLPHHLRAVPPGATRARRASTAASGSDWRSRGTSSRCTAARFTRRATAGQGATFRVRLPLMIVASRAACRPPRASAVGTSRRRDDALPDLRDVRVLVVDDDRDALTMVREIMETAGAQRVGGDSAARRSTRCSS